MGELNKSVKVSFKDVDYEIDLNYEQIKLIDRKVNIIKLNLDIERGDLRYTEAAEFIAAVLNLCGADTSGEEVFTEAFNGGSISLVDVGQICVTMLQAMYTKVIRPSKAKDAEKKS